VCTPGLDAYAGESKAVLRCASLGGRFYELRVDDWRWVHVGDATFIEHDADEARSGTAQVARA